MNMGGLKLTYSKNLNYLGLIINNKLNWTTHLSNQLRKVKGVIAQARKLTSMNWGLTPARLHWIYTAIVRPKISYGALVWAHSINQTLSKRLSETQGRFLRAISGAQTSTPTRGLEAIMGLIPLDLYLEEMATRARIRTKHYFRDSWDGMTKHNKKAKLCGHKRILDGWSSVLGKQKVAPPPKKSHS